MSALILLYHSVTQKPMPGLGPWTVTERQLADHARAILDSGREVLTLDGLVSARKAGVAPRHCVVITFDDGYADNLGAAATLADFGLPATLYVTTGALGRPGMLAPGDLRELIAARWDIGSHGVTHRRLDEIPKSEVDQELIDSRKAIEDMTGRSSLSYAYPHGSYTTALQRRVRRAGFTSAAAVRDFLSADDDDDLALARVTVKDDLDATAVSRLLQGRDVAAQPPTPRVLTEAYRLVRRGRARIRRHALDELDARLTQWASASL